MKRFAAIRTLGTMLAMFACVSVALAASGTLLDEAHRAPAPAPVTKVRATSTAPRAAVLDAATSVPRVPQLPAPDHRTNHRDPAHRTPATSVRVHVPSGHRQKGSARTTPATPGMGLLLHVGTGTGPEFSLLQEDFSCAPSAMLAGRAPPSAGNHPNPARDPIACAAALAPQFVTPLAAPPGVTPSTQPTFSLRPVDLLARMESRAYRPLRRTPDRTLPCDFPERVRCSRAERLRGAAA